MNVTTRNALSQLVRAMKEAGLSYEDADDLLSLVYDLLQPMEMKIDEEVDKTKISRLTRYMDMLETFAGKLENTFFPINLQG